MKPSNQFIPLFLMMVFSCCHSSAIKDVNSIDSTAITTYEKITAQTKYLNPEYIIFGRFCGECSGECATMYRYEIATNKLFVDHTDSYWQADTLHPIKFATEIKDSSICERAKEIRDYLPMSIISRNSIAIKYGCPDCTDGCGIYLEIKENRTIRRIRIDYRSSQLDGDAKLLSEFLAKKIQEIEDPK